MADAYGPDHGVLARGDLYSADFSEKLITLRVPGDMPAVSRGRYAIVDIRSFASVIRAANLWVQSNQ